MQYNDFKSLSLESKAKVVKDNGMFLEWKMEGAMMIKLFKVEDFYAEVWLNSSEFTLYDIKAYRASDYLSVEDSFYPAINAAS